MLRKVIIVAIGVGVLGIFCRAGSQATEYFCNKTPAYSCGEWPDDECACNCLCLSPGFGGQCIAAPVGDCTDWPCMGGCENDETFMCYSKTRKYCQ
jgi:hypothetical protein